MVVKRKKDPSILKSSFFSEKKILPCLVLILGIGYTSLAIAFYFQWTCITCTYFSYIKIYVSYLISTYDIVEEPKVSWEGQTADATQMLKSFPCVTVHTKRNGVQERVEEEAYSHVHDRLPRFSHNIFFFRLTELIYWVKLSTFMYSSEAASPQGAFTI